MLRLFLCVSLPLVGTKCVSMARAAPSVPSPGSFKPQPPASSFEAQGLLIRQWLPSLALQALESFPDQGSTENSSSFLCFLFLFRRGPKIVPEWDTALGQQQDNSYLLTKRLLALVHRQGEEVWGCMGTPAPWPQSPAGFPMASASNHPKAPPSPWNVMAKGFPHLFWESACSDLAENLGS